MRCSRASSSRTLTPARTESQLTRTLDQILAQLPIKGPGADAAADIAQYVEMAEEVLASGDVARALGIFEQLARWRRTMCPPPPAMPARWWRPAISTARRARPRPLSPNRPPGIRPISRARAAIALAREAQPVADLAGLAAQVEANPEDQEARYRPRRRPDGGRRSRGAADVLLGIDPPRPRVERGAGARAAAEAARGGRAGGSPGSRPMAAACRRSSSPDGRIVAPVRLSAGGGAAVPARHRSLLHIFEPRYRAMVSDLAWRGSGASAWSSPRVRRSCRRSTMSAASGASLSVEGAAGRPLQHRAGGLEPLPHPA